MVLLLHFKEFWRSSNTGHLLQLCTSLPQTSAATAPAMHLAIHGRPGQSLDESRLQRGLVLFPGRGGKTLTTAYARDLRQAALDSGARLRLIIPDGTWGQTQRMLRRIAPLRVLKRIELPAAPRDLEVNAAINRPRRNQVPGHVSTFEAVAKTLAILEDKAEIENQLVEFFRHVADRMLWLRGRLTKEDVYGGLPVFSSRQTVLSRQLKLYPFHPGLRHCHCLNRHQPSVIC
jgi:DTW domain-containing protein YfiP